MRKALKIAAIVMVAGLVVIQFFGIDRINPRVVEAETLDAAVSVPADIKLILGRSCNDCHSNTTVYPWYTYIQPVGWFLKDHIDEGRGELNFSTFNTYPAKKKRKKLEEICEEVKAGAMPLGSYLWIHWDAALRQGDAETLCSWADSERSKIPEE